MWKLLRTVLAVAVFAGCLLLFCDRSEGRWLAQRLAWLADVQDALNEFSDTEDICYGFAERVYLPAIDRALWRWGISFYGGLEVPEPEAENDGTGTETGEE